MKKIFSIPSLLILSACATPYVPPALTSTPPAVWSGTASISKLADSPGYSFGIKKVGDNIYEEWSETTRNGFIADEIHYRNPFGKEIIVPAKTIVHAEQLSVTRVTTYGGIRTGQTNLNQEIDPIEWCFKLEKQASCIFWEGETRARYIDMYPLSQRIFFGFNANGMIGPMPKIEEAKVDFGGPIRFYERIEKIDNNGIQINTYSKDGNEIERLSSKGNPASWVGDQKVHYKDYIFTPIKDDSGNITTVKVESSKQN